MRLINFFVLLFITGMLLPAQAQQFGGNLAPAFAPETTRFITVDEAFPFHTYQEGNQLKIDWQVQPGYYLYQSRLSFQSEHVDIKSRDIPTGTPHEDEFFGKVNIFTEPVFVTLTLVNARQNATVTVAYQGCAKQGFCYPPETRVISIDAGLIPSAHIPAPATEIQSEQDRLADALGSNLWSIPLFLILGIGLALTPCVFPMYPIITSIVLGQKKSSRKQSFKLGLIYVQGMALTYTLLGLVVASAGLQFQALLQSPVILIGFSLLFVLLSLSMFGIYTLQMPSTIQTYLNTLSDKQQQGQTLGVFLMGAISGLVCSPCTTAPLSGALLYVAQTGDLLIGGVALYALGLGMGIPLIIIAVFGQQLLPKSGPWMEKVKVLFGFILLAAPIFLLERIIPEIWSTGLWSLLGLSLFIWLFFTIRTLSTRRTKRPLLILCSIAGLCATVLPVGLYGVAQIKAADTAKIHFVRIHNLEELTQHLALAKANTQPVMLDFYADWCVACKEFEKYTFSEDAVQKKLGNYMLLQADVTQNSVQDQGLLHSLRVLGLPTILFWDAQGNRVSPAKITGFMPAETFIQHAQKYHL